MAGREGVAQTTAAFLTVPVFVVVVSQVSRVPFCGLLCTQKDCVWLTAKELPHKECLTAERFLLDCDAVKEYFRNLNGVLALRAKGDLSARGCFFVAVGK